MVLEYNLQFQPKTVQVPPSFETGFENIAKIFDNFQSDATDSQTMTIPNRRFLL
jgi:hypothetical protein